MNIENDTLKSISGRRSVLMLLIVLLIISMRIITACYMIDIYPDEERGLLQMASILETGHSTDGYYLPLYIKNGHGLTTYAFLYPLLPFAALFGTDKHAIRVVLQLFTIASCILLSKSVEIWTNKKEMYYNTLICALTLPWGLIQANRIWDPALVPFYFALFFYLFTIFYNNKEERGYKEYASICVSMMALVMLAVVYPTCRIPAVALWIFSMYILWKKGKLSKNIIIAVIIISVLTSIPLAYNMLFVDGFNSRASSLLIFNGESPIGVVYSWTRNFAEEFSPRVLFVTGDAVSRHSLPIFGVLGTSALIPLIYQIRARNTMPEIIMLVTILFSSASVACTNEYHPHTLRNCLCWPAYAILIAYGWNHFVEKSEKRKLLSFTILILQFIMVFVACILFYNGRMKGLSVG